MIRCGRCGRPMKKETPSGVGPTCLRILGGNPRKRQRAAQPRDERQRDLFGQEVRP